MAYFDQSPFEIRCEWGLAAIDHVAKGQIVVIVDVLSFTTCIDIALSRGVGVLPYAWKDDTAKTCSSGRELIERGFRRDVELASALDVSRIVPVLEGDAFIDINERI